MGHSVWTSKTCESGSESSSTDVERSGQPSVSAKTIAKVEQEQEMLEDRRVTVHELCEWIPEVSKSMTGNMAGEFYDKGIRKMPQCIDSNSDYVKK